MVVGGGGGWLGVSGAHITLDTDVLQFFPRYACTKNMSLFSINIQELRIKI